MKMFLILFLIYIAASIFTVIYFSEVNRLILLVVVYPAIGFLGIGFAAYFERKYHDTIF